MSQKSSVVSDCRLRIDPVLVDKFRRLPGGINEVGTKIIRDLGLRYEYEKQRGVLDIVGPDTEILNLAIETLRFWIEGDEFPDTGITCQVGYPNRGIVIWRFHGDYAKKFDHLFADDIRRLKLIHTVNIKAVPSKRNPEYVELYCHFSVYHQVKDEVNRISFELSKIFQDDFFIPIMDLKQARDFAKDKSKDDKVLYAIKVYPDDKIRVWMFAKDQSDLIKARREWVTHVGLIARDNEFEERSVKFRTKPKDLSPRNNTNGQRYDNPNFPRPPDFVYPIVYTDLNTSREQQPDLTTSNPFAQEHPASELGAEINIKSGANPLAGEAKWVTEDEVNQARQNKKQQNRIYVHHQVEYPPGAKLTQPTTSFKMNPFKPGGMQVVHPEKNLVANERFNPTRSSQSVLTSVTDPMQAPNLKRGKGVRPGAKKKVNVKDSTRRRPGLKADQPQQTVKYNINVNGLEIFMYKQNIVKLNNMDALINVVTPELKKGDKTATLMFEEMGKQVIDEIDVHLSLYGEVDTGENIVTSAGKIPALGVIHVVSPIWKKYTVWEDCASDLHRAIYHALKTAEAHKYRKVALPIIGVEPLFGIPKDLIAEVYVKALIDYSMGMGPLYPVDEDVAMLTYIKDAYESWASMPGVADDMTKHISTDAVQSMRNPDAVYNRRESAVNMKDNAPHRSENMVVFVEQSYTENGEQRWTFDVLRRMTVHVYTGSLLTLSNVEAVVCAMDSNGKGTLVRHLQGAGGRKYREALKKAKGTRTLQDGEVLVTEGGDLPLETVLHAVVAKPVYTASQKNLTRLDKINTHVLASANKHGINVLAMPLIGTSRLRERFEVEQTSLQLVDNIIEVCLSAGRHLHIRELHLVNINHVMTQYITQALRTRAHAKVRLEAESHALSRSEVLSHAEAVRAASPESRAKVSKSLSKTIATAEEKSAVNQTEMQDPVVSTREVSSDETKAEYTGDGERNPRKNNKRKQDAVKKTKTKSLEDKSAAYLSTRMLEAHDRMLKDAWNQLVDEDIDDPTEKQTSQRVEDVQKRKHKQLDPIPTKESEMDITGAVIDEKDQRIAQLMKKEREQRKRSKRRIFQRSSDFIYQKSKAESYQEKFEKKQRYESTRSKNNDSGRVVRSKSSGNINNGYLSESLLKGFETERQRIRQQRIQEDADEMTDDERMEKERFLKETERFFTRGTKDRYRPTNDVRNLNDEFERANRVDVQDYKTETDYAITARSDQRALTRRKSQKHVIDTEREDEYMMDMDYLAKERETRIKEREEKAINNDDDLNHSYTKSKKSQMQRNGRFMDMMHAEKENNKYDNSYMNNMQNRGDFSDSEYERHRKPLKSSLKRVSSQGAVNQYSGDSNLEEYKVSRKLTDIPQNNYPRELKFSQYVENYSYPNPKQIEPYPIQNPTAYNYNREPYPYSEPSQYFGYPVNQEDSLPPAPYARQTDDDVKHYTVDAVVQMPRALSNSYNKENKHSSEPRYEVVKPTDRQEFTEIKVDSVENDQSDINNNDDVQKIDKTGSVMEQVKENTDNVENEKEATKLKGTSDNDLLHIMEEERNMYANETTKEADENNDDNGNGNAEHQRANEIDNMDSESQNTSNGYKDTNEILGEKKETVEENEEPENVSSDVANNDINGSVNSSFKEVDIAIDVNTSTPAKIVTVDDNVKSTQSQDVVQPKRKTYRPPKKNYKTITMSNLGGDFLREKPVVDQPVLLKNRRYKFPNIPRIETDTYIAMDLLSTTKLADKKVSFDPTINQKHNKLRKRDLNKIRSGPIMNPNVIDPNDFSIRDNIRLDIDIVDRKKPEVDETKLKDEKRKIKRFWEVVGGKDLNDEKELYGYNGQRKQKDKMLVTKVKKERVLSAKSKHSNTKTNVSSVHNHSVGKYNVTVEVAN
ncbi:Y508-like protein [Mya arenaria]|uniref:Y508-like protein n=1 Tax=Mya arenaria TaxID=6604 RepID=A0ABY7FJF7_MYAAR|nr:Y508-like protein [Mya arenaria]